MTLSADEFIRRFLLHAFPVERAPPIRAEMKSNAIAAVGVALVDLPLAVEPHLLLRIRRTEMEGGAAC
jgi:hypothetical protein